MTKRKYNILKIDKTMDYKFEDEFDIGILKKQF